jgi:hypothetical protein
MQMKGIAKKMAVLVVIPIIVLFMIATASARGPGRVLWGQYAVTGGGSCFGGSEGFTSSPTWAADPKSTSFAPDVMNGVYTFYPNGKGVFKGTIRVLLLLDELPAFFGGSADVTWNFDYTVTHGGDIEFFNYSTTVTWTSGPQAVGPPCNSTSGNNGPRHGFISSDGEYLSVTCGPGPDPTEDLIITSTDCKGQPAGQLLCIISLVGHRR